MSGKTAALILVTGGLVYWFLRKPASASSPVATRAGTNTMGYVAQTQGPVGAFATGASAGYMDVLNSYYSGQYDAGAAGVFTDPSATVDNSPLFDPNQQYEYDVYNAYHPNGEGPTLEGA